MNRYKNGKIFSLFLMCGILGACDKFEAIPFHQECLFLLLLAGRYREADD